MDKFWTISSDGNHMACYGDKGVKMTALEKFIERYEKDNTLIPKLGVNVLCMVEMIRVMWDALEDADHYLHWNTDNLSGDDLVGDGRLTMRFKQVTSNISNAFTRVEQLASEAINEVNGEANA